MKCTKRQTLNNASWLGAASLSLLFATAVNSIAYDYALLQLLLSRLRFFLTFFRKPKTLPRLFLLSRLSLCLSAEKAINWLLCEFAVRPWVDRDHGKWIVYKHCRLEEIFSCSFAKGNFTLLTSWKCGLWLCWSAIGLHRWESNCLNSELLIIIQKYKRIGNISMQITFQNVMFFVGVTNIFHSEIILLFHSHQFITIFKTESIKSNNVLQKAKEIITTL